MHQLAECSRAAFPTRYVIGIMAFLSSTFGYVIRTSFSLNLLAMVNVYDENGTLIEQPDASIVT